MSVFQQHEIRPDAYILDPRSLGQKINDFLLWPPSLGLILIACGALILFYPVTALLTFLPCLVLFFGYGRRRLARVPVRSPFWSPLLDPSTAPDSGKLKRGAGLLYLGREGNWVPGSRQQGVWADNSDARTHAFVFGTTGAGKTETLLGMVQNALTWGSGLIFVDGKGTPKLYAQIYALARMYGAEDDVLLLNYMLGNVDPRARTPARISNTCNFLASATGPAAAEMCVSLLPEAGGDSAMWKDRAAAMASGVFNALAFLRDRQALVMTPARVREFMALSGYTLLAAHNAELQHGAVDGDRRLPAGETRLSRHLGQRVPAFPAFIDQALQAYLASLPGYRPGLPADAQDQRAIEQHGYLQMQFTKVLGTLSDVYGHIFDTEQGEVDPMDVVLRNRILVVLLPSLEKSEHETRSLGNITMQANRATLSAVMGSQVEGGFADTFETLPTNAPHPYPIIYDEVGYYAGKSGMAVQPAQGRSLGVMYVFAAQDAAAFEKGAGKEEAAAVLANSKFKIFLALEDAGRTWEIAKESAGEATVEVRAGYRREGATVGNGRRNREDTAVTQRSRISLQELKAFPPGRGILIWRDKVVRTEFFYPNVTPGQVRVNTFLAIPRPTANDIIKHQAAKLKQRRAARLDHFMARLRERSEQPVDAPLNPALRHFGELLTALQGIGVPADALAAAAAHLAFDSSLQAAILREHWHKQHINA